MEIVVVLHMRSYYGDGEETDILYYTEAEDGITESRGYATLYACDRDKCYTLAVHRLIDGDTTSSVLGDDPTEPIFDMREARNYDSADGARSDLNKFRSNVKDSDEQAVYWY